MLVVIFTLGRREDTLSKRFVTFAASNNLFDNSSVGIATEVCSALFKNDTVLSHFSVNNYSLPSYMNLVLIDGQAGMRKKGMPAEYVRFMHTVAYTGENGLVVIDTSYLKAVMKRLGVGEFRTFMLWIVGHEAGHLRLEHPAAHFSPEALEHSCETCEQQQREVLADKFFASRLDDDLRDVKGLTDMLFWLMNSELIRRNGVSDQAGPLMELLGTKTIQIIAEGSHPEFLLRAASLLSTITYPPGVDDRPKKWSAELITRTQAATRNQGRLTVSSEPEGLVFMVTAMASGDKQNFMTPADVLLTPGEYLISESTTFQASTPVQSRKHYVKGELRFKVGPKSTQAAYFTSTTIPTIVNSKQ